MRILSIALASTGYIVAFRADDDGDAVTAELDMTGDELVKLVAPRVKVPKVDTLSADEQAELARLEAQFTATLKKVYEGANGRGEEQLAIQETLLPLRARARRAAAVAALADTKATSVIKVKG